MKAKTRLLILAVAVAVTGFVAGTREVRASTPVCQPGEHLWCYMPGDGGPWICYCAAQP